MDKSDYADGVVSALFKRLSFCCVTKIVFRNNVKEFSHINYS
jgi:hypothetical protein